jgi:DNA-directed RNA polymerase specialized sigma24 family protein
MNYIEPSELGAILRDAQARGCITDELVAVCEKIARGVAHRYGATFDADDIVQQFFFDLLRHGIDRIDANGNPFNYFTTMVRNTVYSARNKRRREEAVLESVKAYGSAFDGSFLSIQRDDEAFLAAKSSHYYKQYAKKGRQHEQM